MEGGKSRSLCTGATRMYCVSIVGWDKVSDLLSQNKKTLWTPQVFTVRPPNIDFQNVTTTAVSSTAALYMRSVSSVIVWVSFWDFHLHWRLTGASWLHPEPNAVTDRAPGAMLLSYSSKNNSKAACWMRRYLLFALLLVWRLLLNILKSASKKYVTH